MPKQTVEVLIEGGKATAAPPLGPALGPLGVNISQIVGDINKKTASFAGMQVPVKVTMDTVTKAFSVSVGTPPTSALLKKEAGIDKGSSNPKTDHVADMRVEQIIKVAKMKEGSLLGRSLKEKVKEVMGTAGGLGLLIEGVDMRKAIAQVNEGRFDQEIREEKTELSATELEEMRRERQQLLKEIEARREEFERVAKSIIAGMTGKPRGEIKAKLVEAGVPTTIIEELLPKESVTAAVAAGEATPAAAAGGKAPAAAPAKDADKAGKGKGGKEKK